MEFETRKFSHKLTNALIIAVMIILMVIMIYPLLYTAFASLSDAKGLLTHKGMLWHPIPSYNEDGTVASWINLGGYKKVFSDTRLMRSFGMTIFYVVAGTAIGLVMTIMGAFVVSRSYIYCRNVLMKLMLFTMYFSGGLIPTYILVDSLGLTNTIWAMLLPGCISTYNLIIMRSFFVSLPPSLEESAMIDGANDLHVLLHIVLPLSLPSIAVIGMYYAVGIWNSWYQAMIYLPKAPDLQPLQLLLRSILILNQDYQQSAAGMSAAQMLASSAMDKELVKYCVVMVATVPILIVYPFLQKYFVKGVMIGAVKG